MDFSFNPLHLLYPPLCRHCQRRVDDHRPFFCPSCLDYLTLLEAKERCPLCFCESTSGACTRCRKHHVVLNSQSAALEPIGSAKTLVRSVAQADPKAIAAAASLMAYQWIKLEKKLPDCIAAMPTYRWKKWMRKHSPEEQLAHAVGKVLGLPVVSVLENRWDLAHFLSKGEIRSRCAIVQNGSVTDKSVLLVHSKLDYDLLRSAGLALQEALPAKIEGLALHT